MKRLPKTRGRTRSIVRRIHLLWFVGVVCAFIGGVVLGPSITTTYWTVILRCSRSKEKKWKAALALSRVPGGDEALLRMIHDPNRDVRVLSLWALSERLPPWETYGLLGEFSPTDVPELREIIGGLDYVSGHHRVVRALQYELTRQTDGRIRAEIQRILKKFGVPARPPGGKPQT